MSDEIRRVNVGSVRVFAGVKPDKAQALKPLEEAAEVFGAWQDMQGMEHPTVVDVVRAKNALFDECADVIQAVCNLVASLGREDMGRFIDRCEVRNAERGRYGEVDSDGQEEAGRHE